MAPKIHSEYSNEICTTWRSQLVNLALDRYLFFSRKQKKGEAVEQFYSILKELAENCDFENREEVIIRNIFITNMLDDYIQREILRDTTDPKRALSIAVNMEMGHQSQKRISSNNNNNNDSATGSAINAIQYFNRFCGANARGNQSGRVAVNRAAISQCRECDQVWTTTHRQVWALLWVRNAIIVAYLITSQRYVGKN